MKIKSIKKIHLDTPMKVYDIEVPKYNNFTLDSGVVVHNSKDMADCVAGATWNASLHQEEYSPVSDSVEAILAANAEVKNYKDAATEDLEAQLMNIVRKKEDHSKDNVIQNDDDIDTIVGKVTGIGSTSNNEKLSDEMKNYYASMGIII